MLSSTALRAALHSTTQNPSELNAVPGAWWAESQRGLAATLQTSQALVHLISIQDAALHQRSSLWEQVARATTNQAAGPLKISRQSKPSKNTSHSKNNSKYTCVHTKKISLKTRRTLRLHPLQWLLPAAPGWHLCVKASAAQSRAACPDQVHTRFTDSIVPRAHRRTPN